MSCRERKYIKCSLPFCGNYQNNFDTPVLLANINKVGNVMLVRIAPVNNSSALRRKAIWEI